MAINKVYVLTEKELKELLRQQRMMDENTDWMMRAGMEEDDLIPELPPLLTEWGIINKIFNKNNE